MSTAGLVPSPRSAPVVIDRAGRTISLGCNRCGAQVQIECDERCIQEQVPAFFAEHPYVCTGASDRA